MPENSAQCRQLLSLADEYQEWREWTQWYECTVRRVRDDYYLLAGIGAPPWAIELAVDFYEVYQFVYPFHDYLLAQRSGGAVRPYERLAVDHLARAFLFEGAYEVEKLHILPPHFRELTYATMAQFRAIRAAGEIEDLRVRLGQRLEQLDIDPEILASASVDNMTAPSFHIAFDIIRDEYSTLWLLSLLLHERVDRSLNWLLSRRLATLSDRSRFPSHGDVDLRNSIWLKSLRRCRRQALLPNMRDAEAMELVSCANVAGMAGRTLYLMVSDAPALVTAAGLVGRAGDVSLPNGMRTSALRTLDHIRVCLRHTTPHDKDECREERIARTYASLDEEASLLRDYVELGFRNERAIRFCRENGGHGHRPGAPDEATCGQCPLQEIAGALDSSLTRMQEIRAELDDVEFILKTKRFLGVIYRRLPSEPAGIEADIIRVLMDPRFEERAAKFAERLRRRLTVQLLDVHAQIEVCKRQIRTEQLSVLSRFPFGVRLGSRRLRDQLNQIVELMAAPHDPQKVLELLQGLVKAASQAAELPKHDRELVAATVLLALGRYRFVIWIAEICSPWATKAKAYYFTYLRIIALVLMNAPKASNEVLAACETAAEQYGHDARLCLIYSYAAIMARETNGEHNTGHLKRARDCVLEAFERERTWSDLKAALANNGSYATMLLGDPAEIDKAYVLMRKDKGFFRRRGKSMPASHLDTLAALLVAKSAQSGVPLESRIALLREAVQDLETVVPQVTAPREVQLVKHRLDRARKELAELELAAVQR